MSDAEDYDAWYRSTMTAAGLITSAGDPSLLALAKATGLNRVSCRAILDGTVVKHAGVDNFFKISAAMKCPPEYLSKYIEFKSGKPIEITIGVSLAELDVVKKLRTLTPEEQRAVAEDIRKRASSQAAPAPPTPERRAATG